MLLGLLLSIRGRLIDAHSVGIGCGHGVGHVLGEAVRRRHHRRALVIMLRIRGGGILQGLGLEFKGLRVGVVVFVIADGGRHAVELQANAGGAGPCIRRGGVALDLAPAAALAGSHDWVR